MVAAAPVTREGEMADNDDRDEGDGDEKKGGSKRKRVLLVLLGLVVVIILVVVVMKVMGGGEEKSTGPVPGSLTAEGKPLIPIPPSGLGSHAGESAEGTAVVVQSVNGKRGFFAGPTVADRVYVEWDGSGRASEAILFHPKVGEHVDIIGAVEKITPTKLKRLGLSVNERALVEEQGGFVDAKEVTAAK